MISQKLIVVGPGLWLLKHPTWLMTSRVQGLQTHDPIMKLLNGRKVHLSGREEVKPEKGSTRKGSHTWSRKQSWAQLTRKEEEEVVGEGWDN
jgi:hypothetical protein